MANLKGSLAHNGHNVVGIQGRPGWGKSTLALCTAINLDECFDPANVFYDRRDSLDAIAAAPKRGTYILDEGGNIALSRSFQDRDQTSMMRILLTIRQRHHNLIWCMPNLARADVILREDLLTHKINLIQQGKAKVRTPKLDRDGEFAGWKTWPGRLTWPVLDQHPIWPIYYADKEDAYRTSVKPTAKPRAKSTGRSREELAAIRPKWRDEKGRLTNKPPVGVEA